VGREQLGLLLDVARKRGHRATLICHPSIFSSVSTLLDAYTRGYHVFFKKPCLSPHRGSSLIELHRYEEVLGETVDYVVYEAIGKYDPNTFAALSDTVRGGGLFVVAIDKTNPPIYHQFEESYASSVILPRFLHYIELSDLYADLNKSYVKVVAEDRNIMSPPVEGYFKTSDQKRVYHSALQWFKGDGDVLVLLSRRGRGKSALMGMLLRELCSSGILKGNVYVTSQSPIHLNTLLNHLTCDHKVYPLKHWGISLRIGEVNVVFSPPEKVPSSSVVFVDEASTIPFNLLVNLAVKSQKVVLSATNYGYEGSGKSFQLKLLDTIRSMRPHAKISIEELFEPVRYASGDPLEEAIAKTFLFFGANTSGKHFNATTADVPTLQVEKLDMSALTQLGDEELAEIYGVLTEAHYRNEPRDLSFLLENSNSTTYVYKVDCEVVGVALCVVDGPLSNSKAEAILRGASFPGNLITERLIARSSSTLLSELKGERVVRIAVKPEFQRRGHGSKLLALVEQSLRGEYDWIGASFSAEPETVSFWLKNGYTFTAISWTISRYARYPSVICVKPLSERAAHIFNTAGNAFRKHVLAQINQRNLEASVYAAIVKSLAIYERPLQLDSALVNFAEWNLPAELVVPEIAQRLFTLAHELTLPELESAIRLLRWEASRGDSLRLKKALRRVIHQSNLSENN